MNFNKYFIADFRKSKIKNRKCEDQRCNCNNDDAYCIIETEYDRYAVCEKQFNKICETSAKECIFL